MKWIDVNERLPKPNRPCLVYGDYEELLGSKHDVCVAFYDAEEWKWISIIDGEEVCFVSHWRHMVRPPPAASKPV